jgi:tRNA(Ile)-lysidine synthetase-like protein
MELYLYFKTVLEDAPYIEIQKSDEEILNDDLFLSYLSILDKYWENNGVIAISLSGGVDSMVILKMSILFKKYQSNILAKKIWKKELNLHTIIGIHIDYNNRVESKMEELFLKEYCKDNDVIFECLNIEDINRELTDRDKYEDESRNRRFNFYKTNMTKYNFSSVLIGHHKDDIVENVFTNIMNGRSLLDLSVIVPSNKILDVQITRPLIEFQKNRVFKLAHEYYVPYFKDTTPEWSNRGVLRRQLFPKLEERYGNFKTNLLNVGKASEEWRRIIYFEIIEPFLKNIKFYKYGCIIPLDECSKKREKVFWDEVWIYICHSMGYSCLKKKIIEDICLLLKKDYENKKLSVHKNLLLIITQTKIFVLNPKILDVNSWQTDQMISNNLLNIEKKVDIEDILNGYISYFISNNYSDYKLCTKKFKEEKIYNEEYENDNDIKYFLSLVPKVVGLSKKKEINNNNEYIKIQMIFN